MSKWREQVGVLDEIDAADLLGDVLNHLHRVVSQGEQGEADRQLDWWTRAVGFEAEGLNELIVQSRSLARYVAARLSFARGQSYRRSALRHLHQAIAAADWWAYLRWRWAARAYASAVRAFALNQLALDQLDQRAPSLQASSANQHVRQRVVLSALFEACSEVCRRAEHETAVRLHALDRADALGNVVRAYDAERARMLEERSALKQQVRARRPGMAGETLRSNTLSGQIRELQRADRRAEHAETVETITRMVDDGLKRLREDLGRSAADGGDDLLHDLMDELRVLPQRRARHGDA